MSQVQVTKLFAFGMFSLITLTTNPITVIIQAVVMVIILIIVNIPLVLITTSMNRMYILMGLLGVVILVIL